MSSSAVGNNRDLSASIYREELYKDRWTGFERQNGILKVSRRLPAAELRKFEIFRKFDDSFLSELSPDISVAVWEDGKVLFEEGSYLDLAFYVVKGHVNIFIGKQQGGNGGHSGNGSMAGPDSNGPRESAGAYFLSDTVFQTQVQQVRRGGELTFLSSMDIDLPWGSTLDLGPGEIFGETGASIGWPQSATAQTASQCLLLQIRIPALQKMKRKSGTLKQHLDQVYVDRALAAQLKNTAIFQKCSESFVEEIKQRIELKSFRRNEVIAREGEFATATYLIRSGFVKLSQQMEQGHIVVNYLSKGMTLGDAEYFGGQGKWLFTATSVESTELVMVPAEDFARLILEYPDVEKLVWNSSVARLKESGLSKKYIARSEFLQQALQNGLVEGTSVLVIDLETCTRCDDCVRGCAETHGGAPKFIREGEKYDDFLITRACYHCTDPVCLIGCPTGAIRRTGFRTAVAIEEELCIGCKSCFYRCPYDAITMVEAAGDGGAHAIIEKGEDLLATKCDLCHDSGHTEACVYNCPHGCASRIETVEDFNRLLEKKSDFPRSWSLVKSRKWLMLFLVCLTVLLVTFGLNITVSEMNSGNGFGLVFGTVAFVFLAGAGLLGLRRRTIRTSTARALGSTAAWVQFHLYGGTLFLVAFLMHTGFRLPLGSFYTWLWGLSVWVVAGGFVGVFLQKFIPKVLASGLSLEVIYERIPELVADLKREADEIVSACSALVVNFYEEHVAGFMSAPAISVIYLIDITGGIRKQERRFAYLQTTLSKEDNERLARLRILLKTKTELDAHFTLQKVLRWWLFIHLPASIVLVLLVAIHLAAVLYY